MNCLSFLFTNRLAFSVHVNGFRCKSLEAKESLQYSYTFSQSVNTKRSEKNQIKRVEILFGWKFPLFKNVDKIMSFLWNTVENCFPVFISLKFWNYDKRFDWVSSFYGNNNNTILFSYGSCRFCFFSFQLRMRWKNSHTISLTSFLAVFFIVWLFFNWNFSNVCFIKALMSHMIYWMGLEEPFRFNCFLSNCFLYHIFVCLKSSLIACNINAGYA